MEIPEKSKKFQIGILRMPLIPNFVTIFEFSFDIFWQFMETSLKSTDEIKNKVPVF